MLFGIGHSNHPLPRLLALLQGAGVRWLADVRAIPRSRHNPQYNDDALATALALAGIGYRHLPALGGRRGPQPGIDPALNAHWRGGAFHHYADYALGPAFARALASLRSLGRDGDCAFMCAEADWRQCHRQIIADHLLHAGEAVAHIGVAGIEPARMNPAAHVDGRGRLTYPLQARIGETGDLFGDG